MTTVSAKNEAVYAAAISHNPEGLRDEEVRAPQSPDEFLEVEPPSPTSEEIAAGHPYFVSCGQNSCDKALDITKTLSATLEQIIDTEWTAVAKAYPEGSADYFFAKDVEALLRKKIDDAYTLNYFPTAATNINAPFSDLIHAYYTAPSQGEHIAIVMRREPRFGELGGVDPLGILTETQLKEIDKIYKADTRAYVAMQKTDYVKALEASQMLNYAWASHVYKEGLVSGPTPPTTSSGELPPELEYTSRSAFDLLDDQELIDSILSLKKKYAVLPSHADEILTKFSVIVDDATAYLRRTRFGIDLQLHALNAGTYAAPLTGQNQIETHPNSDKDWMAQIPSLDQLAATSLYLSESRDEVLADKAKVQAKKESEASAEYKNLSSDFLAIQKNFIVEFGPLFPQDAMPEIIAETSRWLIGAAKTATYNFPVGVFIDIVQSYFSFVATIPDGFSHELFCEAGQWLLKALVSCLENNQTPFLTMIEKSYEKYSGLRHEVPHMKKTYEDLLWTVKTLTVLYADGATPHEYSKDIKEDAALTTLESQSPYTRDVMATLASLAGVLTTSTEIITDRSDYETCVRSLSAFIVLSKDLQAELAGNPPTTVLIDFLAGTLPAQKLYQSIKESPSSESLDILYKALLKNTVLLEDEAAKTIYPHDAELIHRVRVALYYIKDKIEIEKSKNEMVNTMTTAQFAARGLDEFKNLLPFGWPKPDGSTPDGRKLDLNLFPDESLYLSWQEFCALFSTTTHLSDEEIATKIKLFFGDWNRGFYRYFNYGGFANNSQEFSVSYFAESVVPKRLLTLFANIIEFAQARALAHPNMSGDEASHQQKMVRALTASSEFLKTQFESPTFNPDYFALMNTQGEYTGVVPKYTDQEKVPLVLDTQTTLWRAKYQSQDLIDISYAAYAGASALSGRQDIRMDNEFELFESVLSHATPLDATDYYKDYIATLGPTEAQYLLGRLMTLANTTDKNDQIEKIKRLKSLLSTLSRGFVESMVADIETAQYFDYHDWTMSAGYPPVLASFLSSLSNTERLWVCGYLQLRLALNSRYDKNTDTPQFEFFRQDKIDDIINGFDALEATYELMKISTLYGLDLPTDEDELEEYAKDPNLIARVSESLTQSPEFTKRAKDRSGADKLFVQLNKSHAGSSFSDLDLLYMLSLVDENINGNDKGSTEKILASNASIDTTKVAAFVADFPQDEQARLYTFLYNVCYYNYTSKGNRYFRESAGASIELFANSDNVYWDFTSEELANGPRQNNEAFSLDDFDDFELKAIYFAWQNAGITPPLPRPEESYSAEYALLLNKILVDANFYANNQKFFAGADNLTNAEFLALISPLLSLHLQEQQRLQVRHDKILAQAVEWDIAGDQKIDPYSEVVLSHVFRDAPDLQQLITTPYNEENLTEASLYSRFDAYAYAQALPAPQELEVIYSRDYFAAQMLVDDPRLLRQISVVLTDILGLIENEADGGKINSWVKENAAYAYIFPEIVNALDQYALAQTLAYYEFHNFNKVEATRVRLELLRCDLSMAATDAVANAEKTKEPEYGYAN